MFSLIMNRMRHASTTNVITPTNVIIVTFIGEVASYRAHNGLLHLWARWFATSHTNVTIITFVGVITLWFVTEP